MICSSDARRSLRVQHPPFNASALDLHTAGGFAAVGYLQFDVYALATTGACSRQMTLVKSEAKCETQASAESQGLRERERGKATV